MTRTETPRTPLPKRERARPPRRDVASIVLAYETGARAKRGIDF